jgi:hypothetical protein
MGTVVEESVKKSRMSITQRKVLEAIAEGHPLCLSIWPYSPPFAYVGHYDDRLLTVRQQTFKSLLQRKHIQNTGKYNDAGDSLWTLTKEGQSELWNPPAKP